MAKNKNKNKNRYGNPAKRANQSRFATFWVGALAEFGITRNDVCCDDHWKHLFGAFVESASLANDLNDSIGGRQVESLEGFERDFTLWVKVEFADGSEPVAFTQPLFDLEKVSDFILGANDPDNAAWFVFEFIGFWFEAAQGMTVNRTIAA